MKLIHLIIASAAMILPMNVQAQTAADVKSTDKKVMAASTPCNAGTEPFKDFLKKFNTDKTFMESRLAISDSQKEKYAAVLEPSTFMAKTPFEKDGEMFYQMWGEIQGMKVYLECGWVDSYYEYTFEFQRKNGNSDWYLTNIVTGD